MSDYDEEDDRPVFGGRGSRNAGIGSGMPSGMSSRLGLGQRRPNDDEDTGEETPTKKPKLQEAGGAKPVGGRAFAAKMMANMGWKEGEGLGAQGRGRLAPIETKLRPQGAGLGAVKEKTKQAKEEERRAAAFAGETIEDSSEEERERKKKLKEALRKSKAGGEGAAGTPISGQRHRKPKYTTAEEVRAELAGLNVPENVLETAFAVTGAGTQPLAAVGGFVSSQPSTVPAETTEVKAAKKVRTEFLAAAEARHGLNDKKEQLADTTQLLIEGIDEDRASIEEATNAVSWVTRLAQELSLDDSKQKTKRQENTEKWENITLTLEQMRAKHRNRRDKYGLEDVAVASIHPLFAESMADWDPLREPMYLVQYLDSVKHLLNIEGNEDASALARRDGSVTERRNRKSTTPYETMIYLLWRPRVRSAIVNNWDAHKPEQATNLVNAWRPLLPSFVYGNLIDQIIVPKLTEALRLWKPSQSEGLSYSGPPSAWIFPWLPFLPERHLNPELSDGLLVEVKRKMRHLLSSHKVERGPPDYLLPWKSLLGKCYQELLTTRLLPRLGSYLSANLVINPAEQDPTPLEHVLQHASFFSPSTMAQLLAAEFFPKFHAILHEWLIGAPNYGEIEQWYSWWKEQIPASIRDVPPLNAEWTKALTTMGQAIDLGDRAAEELPAPEAVRHRNHHRSHLVADRSTPASPSTTTKSTAAEPLPELTFRDVVEEWCTENDLLLIALRQAHEQTGAPLYRITASADQKGGFVCYIRGDVLFARNKKAKSVWEPVGLEDALVERASAR